MSTRRERAKAPATKLNKQLEASAIKKQHQEMLKAKRLRRAKLFEDLAKLVFGGVLIGGVFENVDYPLLLYIIGGMGFFLLVKLSDNYFEKGINR